MNKKEIILNADGSAVCRSITEEACNIVESMGELLSSKKARAARNVGKCGNRLVHLVLAENESWLVTPMDMLKLKMSWRVVDTILLPTPTCSGSTPVHPVVAMEWSPSLSGIPLYFITKLGGSLVPNKRDNWLLAFDATNKSYHLPLPNIFEDGSVCMGNYDGAGDCMLQAQERALAQLEASNWNTDLYDSARQQRLEYLVRYGINKLSPTVDEFIQMPVTGNWTSHCYPCEVAASRMARLVMPL